MGQDVAIVGDCKGVAVDAQLGGHAQTHAHQMDEKSVPNWKSGPIKLFVIFTSRIFVFVVKLTMQDDGVIHPRLDK